MAATCGPSDAALAAEPQRQGEDSLAAQPEATNLARANLVQVEGLQPSMQDGLLQAAGGSVLCVLWLTQGSSLARVCCPDGLLAAPRHGSRQRASMSQRRQLVLNLHRAEPHLESRAADRWRRKLAETERGQLHGARVDIFGNHEDENIPGVSPRWTAGAVVVPGKGSLPRCLHVRKGNRVASTLGPQVAPGSPRGDKFAWHP